MTLQYLSVFLLLIVRIINAQINSEEIWISFDDISSHTCSEEDFLFESVCVLNCSLDSTPEVSVNPQPWIYLTELNDPSMSVILFQSQYLQINDTYWAILNLRTYNSGFYRCQFQVQIINTTISTIIYRDFKMSNSTGAMMYEKCDEEKDCLALNSHCDKIFEDELSKYQGETVASTEFTTTSTELTTMSTTIPTTTLFPNRCSCKGHFDIPYNNDLSTPACLQHKKINQNCNIDEQCYETNESIFCIDNRCQCNGTLENINEQIFCIFTRYLNESCNWNEECALGDANSYCNETCVCATEYKIDVTDTHCVATFLHMNTSGCKPEDLENGTCYLTCVVNTKLTDYVPIQDQFTFIYFSTDSKENVTLFEAEFPDEDEQFYQAIMPLTNYSSGYYQCLMVFQDVGDGTINLQHHDFRVSRSTAVSLDAHCQDPQSCQTLNAQCDDEKTQSLGKKTCNCNGYFFISYSNYSDAPACLELVGEDGNCNLDSQCQQENQSYNCLGQQCKCTGIKTAISEMNGKIMCILAIALYNLCSYNEQCLLAVNNSFCDHGTCTCAEGYQSNTTSNNYCIEIIINNNDDGDGGLSEQQIIAIIVGCAVAIAVIIAVILGRKVDFSCDEDGPHIRIWSHKVEDAVDKETQTFSIQLFGKEISIPYVNLLSKSQAYTLPSPPKFGETSATPFNEHPTTVNLDKLKTSSLVYHDHSRPIDCNCPKEERQIGTDVISDDETQIETDVISEGEPQMETDVINEDETSIRSLENETTCDE